MTRRRRRGPNLLEGIGGFGISFASGIANQWNRMSKSERDKYENVFDYVRGKEKGATTPAAETKTPAPVETPVGQSNAPVQTQAQAEANVPLDTFGPDSSSDQSFIDSSESGSAVSTSVPDAPAVTETPLPDNSAFEEEMRRMQQQAQQDAQQFSSSFNDYSSGGASYGTQ